VVPFGAQIGAQGLWQLLPRRGTQQFSTAPWTEAASTKALRDECKASCSLSPTELASRDCLPDPDSSASCRVASWHYVNSFTVSVLRAAQDAMCRHSFACQLA
jgi:hypothetical protein